MTKIITFVLFFSRGSHYTSRSNRSRGPAPSHYSYRSNGLAPSEVSTVKSKITRKPGVTIETMSAPNPFCPNTKGMCCLMLLLNLGLILVTLGFVIVIQFFEPLFVWWVPTGYWLPVYRLPHVHIKYKYRRKTVKWLEVTLLYLKLYLITLN